VESRLKKKGEELKAWFLGRIL